MPHDIPSLRRPLGLSIATLALLLSALFPVEAKAVDKQQRWDRMIELRAEISALKGQPDSAARLAPRLAEYRDLQATFGGAEPAAASAPPAAPQRTATFPADLPNLQPEGVGSSGLGSCGEVQAIEFSTDTPVAIPDSGSVSSTIDLSAYSGFAQLVLVQIDIDHTFNADLDFRLISPSGTEVTLSSNNGGANDDVFGGTIFFDFGFAANPPGPVTDIVYTNGVAVGSATPEEAMGAFRNEGISGIWTLSVADQAALDVGTLNAWAIQIVASVEKPVEVAYDFASTDTPVAITDLATVTSTINASGVPAGGWLCDVDVTTDITHSFNSDLVLALERGDLPGYPSILSSNNGTSLDNVFAGTTWTDDAGSANPPGPVTDTAFADGVAETPLVPEGAMAELSSLFLLGTDPNTTWTLSATDQFALDTGTINSWNLRLVSCRCPSILEIPALDSRGLGALGALLAAAALLVLVRRRV